MSSLLIVYGGLLVLGGAMVLAQRRWPQPHTPSAFDRSRALDWSYWLVTPLGTGLLTRAVTVSLAALVALAIGLGAEGALRPLEVFHARSPVAAWPLWLQCVAAFVMADFIAYWSHRLRHRGALFELHAVHHAPERLDWLAAARMHPLDDLLDNVLVTLPVLLAGFDPRVFLALGPLFVVHTIYLHAALPFEHGALARVFASPAFHRRHHARPRPQSPTRSTNFGEVLSIWDVIFGTYERTEELARDFGLCGAKLEETWRGQLIEPLRRLAARLKARGAARS